MQYLGGKDRVAKHFAPLLVDAARGRPIWEPFCGGLSVSAALATAGAKELLLSDANTALVAMYQAYAHGWRPPTALTEDDYRAARALPDSAPLKAFALVGCSFGGKWGGGFACRSGARNYAAAAAGSLARKFAALAPASVQWGACDWLYCDPDPSVSYLIYCDPPYAGTTSYGATGRFDSARFWEHARAWARAGSDVYVSEYAAPAWAELVWERERNLAMHSAKGRIRTERLFRVPARCA